MPLIFRRRLDEAVHIVTPEGARIRVFVMELAPGLEGGRGHVRLGIDAPDDCLVVRAEVDSGTRQSPQARRLHASVGPVRSNRPAPLVMLGGDGVSRAARS